MQVCLNCKLSYCYIRIIVLTFIQASIQVVSYLPPMKRKLTLRTLLICSFFLTAGISFAQTQGPNNTGNATAQFSGCLSCPGTDWLDTTNVMLSDNTDASTTLSPMPLCFQSQCYYSRGLLASDFGFTIPGNATIEGVMLDVERRAGMPTSIVDSTVQLMDSTAYIGNNLASSVTWPINDAYVSYGGPTDTWGASLTPSDVNFSQFGIIFKAMNQSTSGAIQAYVDHVRMTVYYSTPSGMATQTSGTGLQSLSWQQLEDGLEVSLNLSSSEKFCTIEVYNLLGDKILSKYFTSLHTGKNTLSLNNGKLSGGIYILRATLNGMTMNRRLVLGR